MAEILLLRHSTTLGNLSGRYIGSRTDEPLCEEGIALLSGKKYPSVERVFASPLKRCMETARILWPDLTPELVDDFRECDFGDFENKNYQELNGNPDYQAWIDSGGTIPFPHGESPGHFKNRCASAFSRIAAGLREEERIAIVVHGGTVMSILERFGIPRRVYFEFQIKNAEGYVLTAAGEEGLWNYRCLR